MILCDALVSEVQYARHVAPIWLTMKPEERGTFFASRSILAYVQSLGIDAVPSYPDPRLARPLLTASYQDNRRGRARPGLFVNHGVGQVYRDGLAAGHQSYSGGKRREGVVLFIEPNETAAKADQDAYPNADVAVVGSPAMDRWHSTSHFGPSDEGGKWEATVAVSFHADFPRMRCPELRTAWYEYEPALPDLAAAHRVLGHAHPRLWPHVKGRYETIPGIDPTEHFEDVLARADCYAIDNSSTLPEFASTGRPVLFLNASHFRRDVEHGMRFWEWPGQQAACDDPADLVHAVERALDDPPEAQESRAAMVAQCFAYVDGRASERAVAAIRESVGNRPEAFEDRSPPSRRRSARERAREAAEAPRLPEARLRRHGASDEQMQAFREAWAGSDDTERVRLAGWFGTMSDDDLAAHLSEDRVLLPDLL